VSCRDLLDEVEEGFARLRHEYRFRKAVAEKAVLESRWSTLRWYDPRPLFFERNGLPVGRPARVPPEKPNTLVGCGLDGGGRVVVLRRYGEHGTYTESFFRRADSFIEVAHFDSRPEKNPVNLLLVRVDDGRPSSSNAAAILGHTYEEYVWGGSLVEEVRVAHAERADGILGPLQPLHTAGASYDRDGKLVRVELHWPADSSRPEPQVEVMFERRAGRIWRPR
jgi:hypothetical protein